VLPLNSVECERIFSAMNYIKNPYRNGLVEGTLDILMQIYCNGPELEEIE